MNGVSNITQKILADAEAYARQNEAQAEEKAAQLRAENELCAKHLAEDIANTAKAEAESIVARARSQAALDTRNALLAARREAIRRAFSRAVEQFCQLPQEQYIELLARMIIRYQTQDAVLVLNARDKEAIGPALLKKVAALSILDPSATASGSFTEAFVALVKRVANRAKLGLRVADTAGDFAGGFILVEGQVDTNCTAEVLIDGMQHELEGEVLRILFE